MHKQRKLPGGPLNPRHARNLFASLFLGWCGSVSVAAEVAFDRYEVVTGLERETVLTGDFLPDPLANVAAVGTDENGERRLRIFALADGAWKVAVEAPLQPGTLFVDAVAFDGHHRLLTYANGRLNWFDPGSGTERLLVPIEIRFRVSGDGGVPVIDIARDLNGNGLDDLLIPDAEGFWISTQAIDGTFAEPVLIGPPEPYLGTVALAEARTYGETGINPTTIHWYLSRVHQADYNRDGYRDLLFWNEDHFDVYFQNEHRQFNPVAQAFTTDVPFDVDGTYALMFVYNDENTLRFMLGLRKKTQLTMLHALRDMNGDGIADLITLSLEGRSLMNHRGTYQVHFGAATPGGTTFARKASATIKPHGRAGALQASGYSSLLMQDFDGDGQTDVLFRDVAIGIFGMVRAMAGKSVALDVEFYRMEDGTFPRQPTAKRRIRPRLYPIGTGVFFPPVLIGDLHGDGRMDLVTGKGREELHVYAGIDAPGAFARAPQTLSIALPDDERHARLVDLNKDAKQDILVYNNTTTPHRLTTLISR